ncbi:hypothetical protein AUJ59_02610 [Candidatus Beckwithbacteria bacterium CG1_02_47_37]|uniref:N-acetyltransferase domain-containing protein n=1 Tax=Candidatus Beckwithbacteria bacterium CG1_02_47_37 TaxID=1805034 RepID=A0A1J4RPT1_9BACT|nr:MAG: hypothetical protein AUJ59_02610 [Candidatus Beckwithbacteria bacterium CG1_02_47_37]
MKPSFRQYNPKIDEVNVFNLWQENFGKIWPLELDTFNQILCSGEHFVAEENQKIIGFIATQTLGEKASILTCLGDDKELLNYVINYLKSKEVKKIQLGNGGVSYFWPGIPTNLPKLIYYFEANDWKFTEDSYDLVRNLDNYQTPEFVFQRLSGINIQTANIENIDRVLEFEKKYFPEWLLAYKHKADLQDLQDIYYAEDDNNNIVGTVFIFSSISNSAKENQIWTKLLGNNMGGIGCLGVRENMRKKGVGLALAAYATEILQTRKVGNVFVGYTWLVDWYGKLGYKVWRQYKMSWKQL